MSENMPKASCPRKTNATNEVAVGRIWTIWGSASGPRPQLFTLMQFLFFRPTRGLRAFLALRSKTFLARNIADYVGARVFIIRATRSLVYRCRAFALSAPTLTHESAIRDEAIRITMRRGQGPALQSEAKAFVFMLIQVLFFLTSARRRTAR